MEQRELSFIPRKESREAFGGGKAVKDAKQVGGTDYQS